MRRLTLVLVAIITFAATASTAPARILDPPKRVSGLSPFELGCNGAPQTGINYINAEVEPWIASDPRRPRNLIGVWQQDRWSNGGANGQLTAVSHNGGRSWTLPDPPPFSRCQGGNAANGGDYERATDPWVSIGPDGDAYQITLAFNDSNPINAITVSESKDGGESWGEIKTLIRDTELQFFNDKESITADPTDSRYIYAVWDRLDIRATEYFGPTYFARSTDGGETWEPARNIYDPGSNNQTISNQIAVLPNGVLVNVFALFLGNRLDVAVMRSTDKGETWSSPIIVSPLGTVGVFDPGDGLPVRTGDIIPDIAVDFRRGSRTLYVVWQDARPTGGQRDQIAFSRSTDGGLTWSAPRRVSQNLNTQAFTASVDVNGRGDIAVTYYDFTFDNPNTPPLDTDAWITYSRDGGGTSTQRERLTRRSFDMRLAPFANGFFVGDYEGLTSGFRVFRPFFAQVNNNDLVNRTDVFAARARAPRFASSSFESVGLERRSTAPTGLAAQALEARRSGGDPRPLLRR